MLSLHVYGESVSVRTPERFKSSKSYLLLSTKELGSRDPSCPVTRTTRVRYAESHSSTFLAYPPQPYRVVRSHSLHSPPFRLHRSPVEWGPGSDHGGRLRETFDPEERETSGFLPPLDPNRVVNTGVRHPWGPQSPDLPPDVRTGLVDGRKPDCDGLRHACVGRCTLSSTTEATITRPPNLT